MKGRDRVMVRAAEIKKPSQHRHIDAPVADGFFQAAFMAAIAAEFS
jgi:hypothetical protein